MPNETWDGGSTLDPAAEPEPLIDSWRIPAKYGLAVAEICSGFTDTE